MVFANFIWDGGTVDWTTVLMFVEILLILSQASTSFSSYTSGRMNTKPIDEVLEQELEDVLKRLNKPENWLSYAKPKGAGWRIDGKDLSGEKLKVLLEIVDTVFEVFDRKYGRGIISQRLSVLANNAITILKNITYRNSHLTGTTK